MMSSLDNFSNVRFYCKASGHSRQIHFKTSLTNVIDYFKSGSGSATGLQSNYVALAGHTAFLPNSINDYYSDHGDIAMTYFTFYRSGNYHWGIKGGGSRWECDDSINGGSHTFHQVYVR